MSILYYSLNNRNSDEKEEAEEEVKKKRKHCSWLFAGTFLKTFALNFFAEWGDRSQVSTILLAGTHPVFSVFCGGCVGYFITSFMAVRCGSVLQKWISPRWITIFGGLMFILFAFQTVLSH